AKRILRSLTLPARPEDRPMWKQFIIPALAVGALTFAITHVVRSQQEPPPKQPLVEPARSPYARTVAGAGVVEARSSASNTANMALQADQLRRAEKLVATGSMSAEEAVTRRQTHAAAVAQLAQADANLKLLRAGAWEADKAVARAAVAQAEAQLGQTRTDLARLAV